MASEAQKAANRRNAEKSTGPKTEAGKAVVAGSALKHGLTADKVVCFDEKWEDFMSSHAALREALEPLDALEEQLVERIALCSWRLRRSSRVEAEMISALATAQPRFRGIEIAAAFNHSAAEMTALSRYEVALDNAMRRALTTLERHQARRRGEVVPAPIEVNVSGLEMLEAATVARDSNNYETKPIFPEKSAAEFPEAVE
jgi:hypothetical protein